MTRKPEAEHEIAPTVREVARVTRYTAEQWWDAVYEAWSYGYDHDQIVGMCRGVSHPHELSVWLPWGLPARVRDARDVMQAQREFDAQIRAHPLRYVLDVLASAEEAAKIRLGEWVRKARR